MAMATPFPARHRLGLRGVLAWTFVLLVALVTILITLIGIQALWSLGPDRPALASGTMPEGDLASLWMAGHLARLGQLDWLYDSRLFEAWRHRRFGEALIGQPWIYPPTVLLLGVPLSFLPLAAAFAVWNVATLAVAVLLLRHARLPWPILLAGLGAPATWRSLILGQYGVVTGALVVAGLLLAPRRPVRAGVMLGLVTLKPQQGLIVPVAWLAARNWRAIAAAAATFAALALTVAAWLGVHAWVLFATGSRLSLREILEAPLPQPNIDTGASVFWMARTLGTGMPAAYALQGIATAAAVVLAFRAWRRPGADPLARMAVTVCLSLFVTPYGYTSDMVAYSVAVASVVARNGWRVRPTDVLLWLWPGFCPVVTATTGFLLTPVALATVAAMAWRRMTPPPAPAGDAG